MKSRSFVSVNGTFIKTVSLDLNTFTTSVNYIQIILKFLLELMVIEIVNWSWIKVKHLLQIQISKTFSQIGIYNLIRQLSCVIWMKAGLYEIFCFAKYKLKFYYLSLPKMIFLTTFLMKNDFFSIHSLRKCCTGVLNWVF